MSKQLLLGDEALHNLHWMLGFQAFMPIRAPLQLR